MEKITAFTTAFVSRGMSDGAFSVIVTSGDQRLERTYKIKDSTLNKAEVLAAIFALSCISEPEKTGEVELRTPSHYLHGLLEKTADGAWLKEPAMNVEYVNQLRDLTYQFPGLTIIRDNESQEIQKLKEISKNSSATTASN